MMPQTNKTLELKVNINGVDQTMDFQLLDNLSPETTAHIESLVESGFYNGLQIYRNGMDANGNPFVIQGGNDPPTGAIKTDQASIAEEFNPDLQFTSARAAGHGAAPRRRAPARRSSSLPRSRLDLSTTITRFSAFRPRART